MSSPVNPPPDAFGAAPNIQSIDIGELMRTLGELRSSILSQLDRLSDLERREFVDAYARATVNSFQAQISANTSAVASMQNTVTQLSQDLAALVIRVSTLESWRTSTVDTYLNNPSVDWTRITNKPTTFPVSVHNNTFHTSLDAVLWSQVGNVPNSFNPDPHTHSFSSLTSVPSTFPPDMTEIASTFVSKTNYNQHSHQYARSPQPWDPGQTEGPSIQA